MNNRKLRLFVKITPPEYVRGVYFALGGKNLIDKNDEERELWEKAEEIAARIYHEQLLLEYSEKVFEIFTNVKKQIDLLRDMTEILDRKSLEDYYGFQRTQEVFSEINELKRHVERVQTLFYPVLKSVYEKLKLKKKR